MSLPRRRCSAVPPNGFRAAGPRARWQRCDLDVHHGGDHHSRRFGSWPRAPGDPIESVPCICDEIVGPTMGARMRSEHVRDLSFLLVPGNGMVGSVLI